MNLPRIQSSKLELEQLAIELSYWSIYSYDFCLGNAKLNWSWYSQNLQAENSVATHYLQWSFICDISDAFISNEITSVLGFMKTFIILFAQ